MQHRIGERLVDGGTFAVGDSLIGAAACERRPVEGAKIFTVSVLLRPGIFAEGMSASERPRNTLNDRDGHEAECPLLRAFVGRRDVVWPKPAIPLRNAAARNADILLARLRATGTRRIMQERSP